MSWEVPIGPLMPRSGIARAGLHALDAQQHFISCGSKALAQGGGLGGNVVRTTCHHQCLVIGGVLADAGKHSNGFITDEAQGGMNLQLLDVLREVAAGHALVDVLVAS